MAALAAALVVVAGCSGVSRPAAPAPVSAGPDLVGSTRESAVRLAENAGPTLVVLSLDPGDRGANSVRVDLQDARGAAVSGAVRIELTLDGASAGSTMLAASDRRGTLVVPHSGHADLRVSVLDGTSAGAAVTFGLELPVGSMPDGTLAQIDGAMKGLHTLREVQTLSGGGPVLLFHFEFAAPDRVRYTTIGPTGQLQETRLIGRDRYDREAGGPWTRADLGFPTTVPYSAYAPGATQIRLIGREHDVAQDVLVLAFVQGRDVYYRIWAGADDHLVRRYVMMTRGHYMTGTYSDYDAALAIGAP